MKNGIPHIEGSFQIKKLAKSWAQHSGELPQVRLCFFTLPYLNLLDNDHSHSPYKPFYFLLKNMELKAPSISGERFDYPKELPNRAVVETYTDIPGLTNFDVEIQI